MPLSTLRAPSLAGRLAIVTTAAFLSGVGATAETFRQTIVPDDLRRYLACFYDFEHPVAGDDGREQDQGSSGTSLDLINGGGAMRVADGARGSSRWSLQTYQINPHTTGNDDWKAGVYDAAGVASMRGFASVSGVTLMGWVKPAGASPAFNSQTPDPNDRYGAIGLFGILSGDSDGHAVRALLEVLEVGGALRLAALGRRVDGASSRVLAATDDWRDLLPANTWTHIAATFDFDDGTMAIYRNGEPIEATYTSTEDQWNVGGPPEPDVASATSPAGIKIGGSFPQNTGERNAFNGRFDDLMFFTKAFSAADVRRVYEASVVGP